MKALEERIRLEGKVLPGNIVKVDGFLNHRVDVRLMREMAREFGRLFDLDGLTAVLTIEASCIALAAICADEFDVPMVFAKKAKSDNIEGGLYQSKIFSYTYRKEVTLIMSRQWLGPDDKVLLVDDLIATGGTMVAQIKLVNRLGAELVGVSVLTELEFFHPRDILAKVTDKPLHSLVKVQ